MRGRCASCRLSQRRGSPQGSVPSFVPTPCVEALRNGAIPSYRRTSKSLITRDIRQFQAILGNACKLLKVRAPLPPEQKVRCVCSLTPKWGDYVFQQIRIVLATIPL